MENSNKIQKVLCVKPTGVFYNPVTRTLFASIISNNFMRPLMHSGDSAQDFLKEATHDEYHINPLLALFLEEISPEPERYSYGTVQFKYKPGAPKVHWVLQHPSLSPFVGQRWMPRSSYFSKAFVSQPPTTAVQFELCSRFEYYTGEQLVTNPMGVTLYDLMTCIETCQGTFGVLNKSFAASVLDLIVHV